MTKIVNVAVGVVEQDNRVLLAWRDARLDQGNCYEFAGGKVEHDETPMQALKRELTEELNITVLQAFPFCCIKHQYPHKTVCLWVFRVTQFTGQPQGMQGQGLDWVPIEQLGQYTFPEANQKIVQLLQLPRQYVITPKVQQCAHFLQVLQHYQYAAWVYLRQPHVPSAVLLDWLLQAIAVRPDIDWSINVDMYQLLLEKQIHSAILKHIKSVHYTTQQVVSLYTNKFNNHLNDHTYNRNIQNTAPHNNKCCTLPILTLAACHNAQQLDMATKLSVDVCILSPILNTATHPQVQPLGLEVLLSAVNQYFVPIYALGGVNVKNQSAVLHAGAFGVAGIGMFTV